MAVGLSSQEGYLESVGEQLVFGTCVHYLIAQDLLAGEVRLDLLTDMESWVGDILVEQYDWTLSKVTNLRDFLTEVAVAYRVWRSVVHPTLGVPAGIEQEMYLWLGEGQKGNIWLRGTPDYIEKGRIFDWKTSRDGWADVKAHLSIQAPLYMALTKQNMGLSVRKFGFWVMDRQHITWDYIPTDRTIKQIDGALNTAFQYGLQVEAGAFPATPVPDAAFNKRRGWYCSAKWCGAWNICSSKYLNDSVDESVRAVRSW